MYLPAARLPSPPYAVEEPYYSQIDRLALHHGALPRRSGSSSLPSYAGIAERQRLQFWSEVRWTELRATYYGMCRPRG